MPLFDASSCDALFVYMGRSSTGGNYPKSPNKIIDHPLKGSFLYSGNACFSLISINPSILRPTMLFSSIIK